MSAGPVTGELRAVLAAPRRRRRSRAWWHLLGYTLATAAGALAHHLVPFLF